jgi:protein-tyrosine phosphatase
VAYRICFVCSGNICRSPMAAAVLARLVEQEGLAGQVTVDSAGTGDWHAGERADRRALAALTGAGYDGSAHRARAFDPAWFADRDLVVALDRGHLRELRALAPDPAAREKVRLLRGFADSGDGPDPTGERDGSLDVADPYVGGPAEFATVLEQVEAGCRGILASLVRGGVVAPADR